VKLARPRARRGDGLFAAGRLPTRLLVGLALVLWVLPAFAAPDTLLENQWHLKSRAEETAGADARAAWTTTLGAGIVIGIVDDGLQHTHPDLVSNYSSALSFDFNFNDADPSPTLSVDFHGTAVAGIAAARGDNGLGVSGAAPLATLAGLRLIAAPTSDQQEADALGYMADAIHIASNSWGPSDDGRTLEGPGPLTLASIANAITTGRNGRGRIFTWAAGNGGSGDNCNFDGYANNRYVIAVGALADTGQAASYSEACSAMFVTAGSSGGSRGITTTDLIGGNGYSASDYTSTFGGTSSATPLVSGMIALMLAQNPNLTWRDVMHVLVRTAVKVQTADAGWTTGAFPHNERFGFGLIDAAAAVNLAGQWPGVGSEVAIPAVTHNVNLGIPDNDASGRTDTITIAGHAGFQVEHVEVVFSATHPYRGDLEVMLTSPSGTVSRLATVRSADNGDNFSAWVFTSVRHWGEPADGNWTLRVADRAAVDVGTWDSWSLRIYGTENTPPPAATLTVIRAGAGAGTVASSAPGINCGADCAQTYGNATSVTLTATAAAGSSFTGWTGGGCSGTGSCSVTVGAATSVFASFAPVTPVSSFALSVSTPGSGSGTVASSPSGIACPPACSDSFTSGTSVTLTATATAGSGFAGWTGGGCSGTGSCTVTVTAAVAVSASFAIDPGADAIIHDAQTGDWFVGRSTGSSLDVGRWVSRFGNRGPATEQVFLADVTGDGKVDAVIHDVQTGDWYVGRSTGASFTIEQWITRFGNRGPAVEEVFVADVTGDGSADAVIHDIQTGDWYVGRSTGASFTIEPWVSRFGNRGPTVEEVFVADLTGDGKADAIVHDRLTGNWYVGRSTGSAFQIELWATGFGNRGQPLEETFVGDVTGRAAGSGQLRSIR
jgi:subtilisin-like proprotein convertase family protein